RVWAGITLNLPFILREAIFRSRYQLTDIPMIKLVWRIKFWGIKRPDGSPQNTSYFFRLCDEREDCNFFTARSAGERICFINPRNKRRPIDRHFLNLISCLMYTGWK